MSSGFKDQSFNRRFESMGDEAEGIFEQVYPRGWARYGLNRPPISMQNLPPFIRFTPDYLTSHGLVEVQGFGRDQTSKFKVAKLDALAEWHSHLPVTLFLYDRTNQEFAYINFDDLCGKIDEGGDGCGHDTFPEGAPFWSMTKTALRTEWFPVPPKAA